VTKMPTVVKEAIWYAGAAAMLWVVGRVIGLC